MRLVFVTQRIDPADPVLGATVAKVRALAERCDEVVVLADGAVPGTLPDNCRVHLFRSGTKAGRGARFAHTLVRELRRKPRPAAVVAHMCPIYAVLAAPLARPIGVRVVLWYTHWNRTRTLDLALGVSNVVASVDARSVPAASAKVVGIGHGIDVDEFSCVDRVAGGPLEALALGRYSAAKGLEVVVRAVALARADGVDVRLRCHGTAGVEQEQAHLAELERLVAELELGEAVALEGPVARPEVPRLLRTSDLLVNNMRAGAPDKAVYEACAACVPVVVSNPPFDELLGDLRPRLLFDREDPADLAARLADVAALGPEERGALGRELRGRVAARHSVESWADAIVGLSAGAR